MLRKRLDHGVGIGPFIQGAVGGLISGLVWCAGVYLALKDSFAANFAGYAIIAVKSINPIVFLAGCLVNAKNAIRILAGRAYSDEHIGFLGGLWQIVSRLTWEFPQTWLGNVFSQARNLVGAVDAVAYLGGATYVIGRSKKYGAGVSIGNIVNLWTGGRFNGDISERAVHNPVFMHEYGHYVDSQILGPLYLLVVGLPSLCSAISTKPIEGEPAGVTTHDFAWYEMRANRHAAKYFGKHYGILWEGSNETYFPKGKRQHQC